MTSLLERIVAILLAAVALASQLAGDAARQESAGSSELPEFHSSSHLVTADSLGASYRPGCPVGPDQLRRLDVSYVDFTGGRRTGSIVVNVHQTANVTSVFKSLYDNRFPIQKLVPVDQYEGSDERSMADGNTSAFNCRKATGGAGWSEHSFGTAIDLNPVQNPYVSESEVLPEAGQDFVDRSVQRPGMVIAGGIVVRAFADAGWRWGGDWTSPTDYQHFSVTGR